MKIYPAIDILNGKCVRLVEGKKEKASVYFENPVDAAKMWVQKGATQLHVIDLDGAFEGKRANSASIERLIAEAGVPVQVGGGIRTYKDVLEVLAMGADKIILGTAAVTDDAILESCGKSCSDRTIVSVDSRDGLVAIDGWVNSSRFSSYNFARKLTEKGFRNMIYTDVRRDGTLKGPDLDGIDRLCGIEGARIIASGGVRSLDDLRRLKAMNVDGVIIGSALYQGSFSLEEALAIQEV